MVEYEIYKFKQFRGTIHKIGKKLNMQTFLSNNTDILTSNLNELSIDLKSK